jgi:ubiquinone/menaquinone biosynthesis C-methylase UbiE
MEKQTVERLYDWLAPLYGLWAELFETRARRRAEEISDLQRGETLLEVAIGTGKYFARLARARALKLSVGMDISPGMLRRAYSRLARKAGEQIYLCRGDATGMSFRDGVFDVILSCYMLDLLEEEDLSAVLAEFRRVLKVNGRLVVISMAEQSRFFNKLWMNVYRRVPLLVGGCRPIFAARSIARCGWQVRVHEEVSQTGFRTELVVALPSRIL